MNDKQQESSEQPVREAVLKALNEKMQNTESEGNNATERQPPRKRSSGNISYSSSPVRVTDTLGAICLGILSILLLLALLSAHRRERKANAKQIAALIKAQRH